MKVRNTNKKKLKNFIGSGSTSGGIRILLSLFVVEIAFLFYSFWRGNGEVFAGIATVLIPLTLITCVIVYLLNGDVYLVIWNTLLLNMGFLIQAVSYEGNEEEMASLILGDMKKLLAGFAIAFLGALVFRFLSDWLSFDFIFPLLLILQTGIVAVLHLFGTTVGEGKQEAKIQFKIGSFSLQPLEFIKIIFIFALVILLCKNEYKDKSFLKMPREVLAAAYILYTVGCVLSFKEGGTALILLLVGIVMVLLFGDKREIVKVYVKIGAVVSAAAVGICVLLHDKIPFLSKVYERLCFFIRPDSSYQAVQAQKALAMGGLFGPVTNRYLVYIPRQEEDMIFSKLIGSTGLIVGMVAVGAVLLMFRQGYIIAKNSRDSYYKGLAMGFSIVLVMEAAVHIAYNLSLFPITGIPLYFVSHGFTSMTCGLLMVAFLVVISRGTQERSLYAEEDIYKRFRRSCK